jgi:hypothetical protein
VNLRPRKKIKTFIFQLVAIPSTYKDWDEGAFSGKLTYTTPSLIIILINIISRKNCIIYNISKMVVFSKQAKSTISTNGDQDQVVKYMLVEKD